MKLFKAVLLVASLMGFWSFTSYAKSINTGYDNASISQEDEEDTSDSDGSDDHGGHGDEDGE